MPCARAWARSRAPSSTGCVASGTEARPGVRAKAGTRATGTARARRSGSNPVPLSEGSACGGAVRYMRVEWCHDHEGAPTCIYAEVDGIQEERRTVERYLDGRLCYADAVSSTGDACLADL